MIGNDKILVLQDRDLQLFREVAAMHQTNREQIQTAAGFDSTTRANTRLLKLYQAGFLHRFFHGTISGGRQAIYSLSSTGAAAAGVPVPRVVRMRGGAAALFVEHRLLINEIYLNLKFRPIPIPGVRFCKWVTPAERLSKSAAIIPDGYFELESANGLHSMFLEVDLTTEPLNEWQHKCEAYLRFATTGEFHDSFGRDRFRVLIITQSDRRGRSLQKLVLRFTDKIFWFATLTRQTADKFWTPIWLRPSGIQTYSLL